MEGKQQRNAGKRQEVHEGKLRVRKEERDKRDRAEDQHMTEVGDADQVPDHEATVIQAWFAQQQGAADQSDRQIPQSDRPEERGRQAARDAHRKDGHAEHRAPNGHLQQRSGGKAIRPAADMRTDPEGDEARQRDKNDTRLAQGRRRQPRGRQGRHV